MMAQQGFSDAGSIDEFKPISPSRCQELLESQSIGRIAWQAADGPQILPVTYAYHERTIIFRTSPYGVLSELVRPTDVAMEIDELDQKNRQGWSVVVQGRAQGVAEPDQLVRIVDCGRCRSVGLGHPERVHPDHSPPDNRPNSGRAVSLKPPRRQDRRALSQLVARNGLQRDFLVRSGL